MKFGAVIAAVLAVGGVALGVYAFIANASPYVSAKEAAANQGAAVNVAGTISHESVHSDAKAQLLTFELIDDNGDRLKVVYKGMRPTNFDSAPKASVSGKYKNGVFEADKITTQCPSKYESEDKKYLPTK